MQPRVPVVVWKIPRESGEETKESKVQNPRELDDARYAALVSRAHSHQARVLVDAVTDLVAEHEIASSERSNKRKKKATLRTAVERLLADLLQAQLSEKNKGYVYRSMRPESFTDSDVGYRVFRRLVDAMADLGLLEIYKGFQVWSKSFGKPLPRIKKAARFRATQALLDICDKYGVHVSDFHQHFLIPLPDDPLNSIALRSARSTAGRYRASPCGSSKRRSQKS